MNIRYGAPIAALTLITALATTFTIQSANAQDQGGFGGGGQPGGGNRQPGGGQPGGRQFGGGGMGGGAAMTTDGTSLYILQGNRILRLNKTTLVVEKEATLPAPAGMPAGGGGFGGGGRPGGADTNPGK